MLTPRQYQVEAIEAILGKWREGVTRQLLSLPTRTGKQ
jgi:superfamily II DNA or RNA helicase